MFISEVNIKLKNYGDCKYQTEEQRDLMCDACLCPMGRMKAEIF